MDEEDYYDDSSGSEVTIEDLNEFGFQDQFSDNKENKTFEVLDLNGVLAELNALAQDTYGFTGISSGVAKTLLGGAFQWNLQELYAKFVEYSDKSKFFGKYHVLESDTTTKDDPDDCQICFCEPHILGSKSCGHLYCSDCWSNHLKSQLEDGKNWLVKCMQPDCGGLLNEDLILLLTNGSDSILDSYRKQMAESFVQVSKNMKWCPGADCGRVIKSLTNDLADVKCQCNTMFCFSCNTDENHEPVSCAMLKHWISRANEESASLQWINTNSKPCPNCTANIEKNGGCNHMTCRSCRFEFCWLCNGDWGRHHGCNRLNADQANRQVAQSEVDLKALTHYYDRYANHKKSTTLEQKLKAEIDEKITKLINQKDQTKNEVTYINKAFAVLRESRRTLMYSYAFVYYVNKCPQTELFVNNQADLELATENLSAILERNLDLNNVDSWKEQLINSYKYVDQRRTALVEHVAHGKQFVMWDFKNHS